MVFCLTFSAPKRVAGAIIFPGTVIFTFHFLIGGTIFETLIHTVFRCATGENQSVLEWSGDINSESRRFQFARGTNPRLSQSTGYDHCCYDKHPFMSAPPWLQYLAKDIMMKETKNGRVEIIRPFLLPSTGINRTVKY